MGHAGRQPLQHAAVIVWAPPRQHATKVTPPCCCSLRTPARTPPPMVPAHILDGHGRRQLIKLVVKELDRLDNDKVVPVHRQHCLALRLLPGSLVLGLLLLHPLPLQPLECPLQDDRPAGQQKAPVRWDAVGRRCRQQQCLRRSPACSATGAQTAVRLPIAWVSCLACRGRWRAPLHSPEGGILLLGWGPRPAAVPLLPKPAAPLCPPVGHILLQAAAQLLWRHEHAGVGVAEAGEEGEQRVGGLEEVEGRVGVLARGQPRQERLACASGKGRGHGRLRTQARGQQHCPTPRRSTITVWAETLKHLYSLLCSMLCFLPPALPYMPPDPSPHQLAPHSQPRRRPPEACPSNLPLRATNWAVSLIVSRSSAVSPSGMCTVYCSSSGGSSGLVAGSTGLAFSGAGATGTGAGAGAAAGVAAAGAPPSSALSAAVKSAT